MYNVLFIGGRQDGRKKEVIKVMPSYMFHESTVDGAEKIVVYRTEVFTVGKTCLYLAIHKDLSTADAINRIFNFYSTIGDYK